MNFEILLSTQNKTSLDFLDAMFIHNDLDDFNLLIINQTEKGKILESNSPKIRVINAFEKGSPLSRNLAITEAKGDICLMADDDIVYEANFKQSILEAYQNNPSAELITFEAYDGQRKRYLKYPDQGAYKKNKFRVNTYVISFIRESVQRTNTLFNLHFGVGSTFPGSTEFLFMSNAWKHSLKMFHEQVYIVTHPNESSGKRQGSDDAVKTRTALRHRLYGWLSVPWLVKYLIYMTKFGYIQPKDFFRKFKVGLRGIKAYRNLVKAGKMN